MESVLQGSLRYFPVGELLMLFGAHAHTGTLEVMSRKRSTKIVFDGGKIVWSESTHPAHQPKEGADPGAHVEQIVLDLFSWIGGRFQFSAEFAPPDKRVAIDPTLVIGKGADWAEQTKAALKLYPNEQQRFRVIEDPASKAKISLSPDEFKILMKMGDGKTLEELCEDLAVPCAHFYPLVKNLHTNGLIAPLDADKEEPKKPAEKPAEAAPRERKEDKTPAEKPPAEKAAAENPAPEKAAAPPETPAAPAEKAAGPAEKAAVPAEKAAVPAEKAAVPAEKAAGPAETPAPAEKPAAKEEPSHETRPADPSLPVIGSLTQDEEGGAVYPLIDDEHTIGRDSSNSIPIVDGSVSGKHARIFRTDEGFTIEDLKSRNGTFVNGEKVTEKKLLGDNDLIRIGKVILMYNIARENESSGQTMGRRE